MLKSKTSNFSVVLLTRLDSFNRRIEQFVESQVFIHLQCLKLFPDVSTSKAVCNLVEFLSYCWLRCGQYNCLKCFNPQRAVHFKGTFICGIQSVECSMLAVFKLFFFLLFLTLL